MAIVTLILAIIAIVVSCFALYAQFTGLWLAKNADKFSRSGKPTVSLIGSTPGATARSYEFSVFNGGQAALSDLYANLHDGHHQDVAVENGYVGPLAPNGRQAFTKTVRDAHQSANPLHIHLTWYDSSSTEQLDNVSRVSVPYT
jgi:hypothetical protein